jgi:hypothetical protein
MSNKESKLPDNSDKFLVWDAVNSFNALISALLILISILLMELSFYKVLTSSFNVLTSLLITGTC